MSNFIRENPLVKTNGNSSESPSVTDQSQSRSCVLDKSNDQITVDDIFNLGKGPGHISDDGTCISSLSSDSRWKSQAKGPRLISQPDSLVKPKHNRHVSQLQRSHQNDPKMVPRSSTVSYSSSKSSTPMKQETSRISHNTSIRSEGPVCRICHEGDQTEVLISPCYCAGSMGLLHVSCLQRWLGSSNKTTCEICNFKFTLSRRAKPVKEFLRNPGTARDKRNLVCDIISFLFITPLTVLTTWVSIAGAYNYYENSPLERGGLIGLATTLWLLYLVWFLVDGASKKQGSCSTLSNVHLQGIQITVSGPTGKPKRKRGTGASPRLTPALKSIDQGALKENNRDIDGKNKMNRQTPSSKQVHRRIDLGNLGQRNLDGTKSRASKYVKNYYRDRFPEDRPVNGTEGLKKGNKRQGCGYDKSMYSKSKSSPFDYYSDPERGFGRNTIPPLWETQEHGTDTKQPAFNRYSNPVAIFSRGNSPEDSNEDKTVSRKYTEDWLDLKAYEEGRTQEAYSLQEGSDVTTASFHSCTCMEGKSTEKKDM